jgi:hypothetical protein
MRHQIERLLAVKSVECSTCASNRKAPSSIDGTKCSEEGDDSSEGEKVAEECSGPPSTDDSRSPELPEIYLVPRVPKCLQDRHKEMKGACCWPSRKPIAVRQLITLEPKAFEILPRNRFRDFDDHFNRPSLEDLQMFQQQAGLDSQPLDWYAQPTVCSPWELFRDWGYRLEPEFALTFASEKPQNVMEHLLPVSDNFRYFP